MKNLIIPFILVASTLSFAQTATVSVDSVAIEAGVKSAPQQCAKGERPQRPEGAKGERPERPEGAKGERPQRPEGAKGERPQRPEGVAPVAGA